jgi:hypothetical protein
MPALQREERFQERGKGSHCRGDGDRKNKTTTKKEWVSSITTVLCRISEVNRKALYNLHVNICFVNFFVTEPGFQRSCKGAVCVTYIDSV